MLEPILGSTLSTYPRIWLPRVPCIFGQPLQTRHPRFGKCSYSYSHPAERCNGSSRPCCTARVFHEHCFVCKCIFPVRKRKRKKLLKIKIYFIREIGSEICIQVYKDPSKIFFAKIQRLK